MLLDEELKRLNPQQKKVVENVEGRLLVLAGAGSGKTKVLTLRMAFLIEKKGVLPEQILGLTFTNKAASEMRHRLGGIVSPKIAKKTMLSTFHSFCMHILRNEIHHLGYTAKFSLYDEQDVQRLVNLIARDLLDHEGDLPSLASTMRLVREARNKGASHLYTEEKNHWHADFAQEVYKRLQDSMRAYNAVDFDHLLGLVVELFERFPDILEKYQDRFRYIMIDEYQDTNLVQYRLAHLLSSGHSNLCVVGDDDQSIYGWRGADVKNILDFKDAITVKLEQNYRSTNTILKAANAVIHHNQQRHSKALWSSKGEGDLIEIFHAPTELEEAQSVVKRLLFFKESQELGWRDFAILYRSNALSRSFEIALMKEAWKKEGKWIQGIPYQVFGGQEFYERKEVKDLCAYLRVVLNPLDQEAILRIINQPRRGIGEDSLDLITAYNRKHSLPLWEVLEGIIEKDPRFNNLEIPSKAFQGCVLFVSVIREAQERFASGALADSVRWLLKSVNYDKAIRQEVKSEQMRDFKKENIEAFIKGLESFELSEKGSLEEFLAHISLNSQEYAKSRKHDEDQVHLMTFHSSKGLEFPVCFLVGVEDHIMPHEKSLLETGLEEERRLMYVAMTRAKQKLVISMAKVRKRMGKEEVSRPSRFLFEIPKELLSVRDWRASGQA